MICKFQVNLLSFWLHTENHPQISTSRAIVYPLPQHMETVINNNLSNLISQSTCLYVSHVSSELSLVLQVNNS